MPTLVVLISGKRFCGKDFFLDQFKTALADHGLLADTQIFHLANQMKLIYSKTTGANYEALLSDRKVTTKMPGHCIAKLL